MLRVTIDRDPYAYGQDATRDDVDAFARQLAAELAEGLCLDPSYVEVTPDATNRHTVRCDDREIETEARAWLQRTLRCDGWIAVMRRALGES